jgi:hypothetical protein
MPYIIAGYNEDVVLLAHEDAAKDNRFSGLLFDRENEAKQGKPTAVGKFFKFIPFYDPKELPDREAILVRLVKKLTDSEKVALGKIDPATTL